MKFSKQIPYNKGDKTLGPVSMKIWFFIPGEDKRIKLNNAAAELVPGSGWDSLVELTTSFVQAQTIFQIVAALTRPPTIKEYESLVLGRKSIPINSTLSPEASLPGMGIPVPIGGAPVMDQIDITIPGLPQPELETKAEYAGADGSGKPQANVTATIIFPLKFTDEEIARVIKNISIKVTDGRSAVTEGPESIEGVFKKKLITGLADPDIMKQARVIVTVSALVFGIRLEQTLQLTFESACTYILNIKPGTTLHVTPKTAVSFSAEVLSEDKEGNRLQAKDAVISLDVPSDTTQFMTVSPVSGTGVLKATISQINKTDRKEVPLSIHASVMNEEIPDNISFIVVFGEPPAGPLQTGFKDGKNSISPFLQKDQASLKARLTSTDNQPVAAKFTFEKANPAGWLDGPSDQWDCEGWTAVTLEATSPDPDYTGDPPTSEDVIVKALIDGKEVGSQNVPVLLLPRPRLEADTWQLGFVSMGGDSADLKGKVMNGGDETWSFNIERDKSSKPLVEAVIKESKGPDVTLTFTEQKIPIKPESGHYEIVTFEFSATPGKSVLKQPLQEQITIHVYQEGLYVVTETIYRNRDGSYHIRKDDEDQQTIIDFQFYRYDKEEKRAIVDIRAITPDNELQFEVLDPEGSIPANVAKVSKLEFAYHDIRDLTPPSAMYFAKISQPIPADGKTIKIKCLATVSGDDIPEDEKSREFFVGIETLNHEPGSEAWDVEVKNCELIIRTLAPKARQQDLLNALEKKKRVMGVEGLVLLRGQIYVYARDLTLQEARDYLEEAETYDKIVTFLEWLQWAGDLAFSSLLGIGITGKLAPLAHLGIPFLKGKLIAAIQAYEEGRPIDSLITWDDILSIVEGKIIDPDMFEKLAPGKKALAYVVFFEYHFFKNLTFGEPPKNTICGAAEQATRELTNQAIGEWLNEKVKTHGNRPVSEILKPAEGPVKTPGKDLKKKPGDKKPDENTSKEKSEEKKVKDATEKVDKAKAECDAIKDKSSKEAKTARDAYDKAKNELEAAKVKPEVDKAIEDSKDKVDQAEKKAFEEGRKAGQEKVDNLKNAWEDLQKNPNDPEAKKRFADECEKVQKDKHAMHVLNDVPHEAGGKTCKPGEESPIRRDFNEQWKQTYANTDEKVKQRIADQLNKNLKPGEQPYSAADIEVAKITNVKDGAQKTPDQESIKSTFDRDVTYRKPKQQLRIDPHTGEPVIDTKTGKPIYDPVIDPKTGKPVMEDVHTTNEVKTPLDEKGQPIKSGRVVVEGTGSKDIYNQEFYKQRHGDYPYQKDAAGNVIKDKNGNPVVDQAKCNKYAKQNDQAVTDQWDPDAYGGGQEDIGPATRGDMKGKPYKDVGATAKTMETKVNDWFNDADKTSDPAEKVACKEEGMRQLTKQFKNQIEPVVNKYNEIAGDRHPPIAKIPDNVRTGVEIMNRVGVGEGKISVAEAEAALKQINETPQSIAEKMSGLLESGQKFMSPAQKQKMGEYLATLPDV